MYSAMHGERRLSRIMRDRREHSLVRQWLCAIVGHPLNTVSPYWLHGDHTHVDWGLLACRCGRSGESQRQPTFAPPPTAKASSRA